MKLRAYELANYFSIGSDPEIFVENKKGIVIPAFEFLGSKEKPDYTNPTKCYTRNDTPLECGSQKMYWDGFQAEFTTIADRCLGWQVDSVHFGLQSVIQKALKKFEDAKLSSKTVIDIPKQMLIESKDEHVQFGCMPSLNAYGIEGLKLDGRDVPFRPAGGHIHFGIGNRPKEKYKEIVKALDAIIGVACVSLFQSFDERRRRELYGLAGEYRTPPHGLEYRTLSNAWLFHPLITNIIFDVARKAMIIGDKYELKGNWKCNEKEVIECIQNCDVKLSHKILKENKDSMFAILKACYAYIENADKIIYNTFIDGMESVVKDPTQIESNWNLLDDGWVNHSDGKGKKVSTISIGKKVA